MRSAGTRRRRAIPAFALYGEAGPPAAGQLHIEEIQARSRLYRWEIDAHVHHGLHQLLWLRAGPAPTLAATGLCYIMFTSGTTGQPKGVQIGRESVQGLIDWMRLDFGLGWPVVPEVNMM